MRALLPFLFLFSSFGCAHAPREALPSQLAVDPPTTLGIDDVFEMRVYGENELTGTYRISADGSVSLPLAGRVPIAGMAPAEAATTIEKRLSQYLRQPYVSIFVKEYNSKKIYVFGEVRTPGTFAFQPGMSIVQAITLAGGFDKMADTGGTLVNRVRDGQDQRLRVSVKAIGEGREANFLLHPGDIVYVPETFF